MLHLAQNLGPLLLAGFGGEGGKSHLAPVYAFHSRGIGSLPVTVGDGAFQSSTQLQEVFLGPACSHSADTFNHEV